jgi:DNA (cytosine-5)-methyltransferase 1
MTSKASHVATKKTGDVATLEIAAQVLNMPASAITGFEKRGLINHTVDPLGNRLYSLPAIQSLISPGQPQPRVELRANKGKLKVAELFCGAGGLALGMHHAGLNTILATDWDADCIRTIQQNEIGWNASQGDVSTLNLSEFSGKIDVLTGGFPCQAFSYAGNRLGFGDTRGTLFFEYARLVRQLQPKLILAENVKGLLSHDDGRTLKTMLAELRRLGYNVAFRVLRSQFLDVPQKRERLIIIGLRADLGNKIYFPREKPFVTTLRSALLDVPPSEGASYPAEKARVMALVPEGGNWRDLPTAEQKKYMKGSYSLGGGKTGLARRLAFDEPSLTLTTAPAQNQTERCHPTQTRPLTVREYARIQTFPDDWHFAGSVASQYRQIGNAVPVNLAYHIGIAIRHTLGEKPKAATSETPLEIVIGE